MTGRRIVAIFLLVGLVGALVAVALGDRGGNGDNEGYVRQPVHWYLVSIEGAEVTLTYALTGAASECEREAVGDVREDAERVVITAYKEVQTDPTMGCTDEIALVDAQVTLDRPLGSRMLLGCRPERGQASEDEVCRDLERSREVGVLDVPR